MPVAQLAVLETQVSKTDQVLPDDDADTDGGQVRGRDILDESNPFSLAMQTSSHRSVESQPDGADGLGDSRSEVERSQSESEKSDSCPQVCI